MRGFYVLTKNRDLQFHRKSPGLRDSDMIRRWEVTDEIKPAALWRIAIESRALGLTLEETERFLCSAGLDEASGRKFAYLAGIAVEGRAGLWLATLIRSGGRNKPPVTKMGAGSTLVGALAELVRPGIFMAPKVLEGVIFEGVPAA